MLGGTFSLEDAHKMLKQEKSLTTYTSSECPDPLEQAHTLMIRAVCIRQCILQYSLISVKPAM